MWDHYLIQKLFAASAQQFFLLCYRTALSQLSLHTTEYQNSKCQTTVVGCNNYRALFYFEHIAV
jgi:hypothetical protein